VAPAGGGLLSAPKLPLDAGLLARLRAAGGSIRWRNAPSARSGSRGRRARIANLHEEEARVETWGTARSGGVAVDSGPVGALVLLLEAAARGPPSALGAGKAGRDPAFPSGSLVATWGSARPPVDSRPTLEDVVELARYALV
jgi:hypothetical protein